MSGPALAMEDRRPASMIETGGVEASASSEVEVGEEIGAWPETMEDFSFYADSAMSIPGKGEKGPGCGEWMPREFCDTCGELHAGPHKCHQRTCPDCWTAWTARRAEAICRRIQSARWAEPSGIRRRTVHAVASPAPGEVRTLADVRRYRRKAWDRVKDAGVRGGVCIFHGYRVKDEYKDLFRVLKDRGEVEEGLWKWVRENTHSWRSQTYWSPHFHFIGLCEDFEADDSDGWVLRRLSSLDAFENLGRIDSYESVVKVSRYLLSHATFETDESVKAVTWGGEVHPSNFQAEEELSVGAVKVIERLSEEAAGGAEERGEGGEDDLEDCSEDECEGSLRPIFDAGRYLSDPDWCEVVGRDAERRVALAFDWSMGEIVPPPGMRNPSSREEMWEIFDALEERY